MENAGSGKAQLFDQAVSQVVKLLRMNTWEEFQLSRLNSSYAKKPLKGKALRKAFVRTLDPDVVTAAIWVFTQKRVSKQEIVQLKKEEDLHEVSYVS